MLWNQSSTVNAMSKRKNKTIPQEWETTPESNSGFVRVFTDMIKAPAFTVLSGNAVKVYLTFKSLWYPTDPTIQCAYSLLNKQGLNNHAIKKALRELEALGFIRITKGSYGRMAKYTFSKEWKTITNEQAQTTKKGVQKYEKQKRKSASRSP